ncbi:hypothetical protein HN371_24365 [Candidatus Poribacteria bacterium]|nr:hypothetical protein [Candidatus Poribacteria bacterium]MBT5536825.1 hypothetical protein [Candidatus Poribacteria bacterium]MBT5710925.1 hypothetical protein [Candidatus Poribacteria bacterium]MBT7096014.1 hypothetical protein [Candidatus Poribacteria bacterium]MBT7808503.1 hypothetical protein [Candidatus Poribacteria bacterium]
MNRQDPEWFVEIHPDDAALYGVDDGEWVGLLPSPCVRAEAGGEDTRRGPAHRRLWPATAS